MELNTIQIKELCAEILDVEYGFRPSLKKIVLLESSGDCSYILFKVGCREYRYDSGAFEKLN